MNVRDIVWVASMLLAAPVHAGWPGDRANCKPDDMVGNVWEWAADSVPRSTACGSWAGSGDRQCLAGADTTGEPAALFRGGSVDDGTAAGPLAVKPAIRRPSGAPRSTSAFGVRASHAGGLTPNR